MIYLLPEKEIETRIARREAKIGFVGLGRVGLPLAATLAGEGFSVLGVDINPTVVETVNAGKSPFPEETGLPELMGRIVAAGKLQATRDIARIKGYDVVIIAVPTLIRNQEPEIDAVVKVAGDLAGNFTAGTVVVLQSTVPPFTARNVVAAAIEKKTGLKAGADFGLAYSPERTQAPQVLRDLRTYPKIVGGLDARSTLVISGVYGSFAPGIMRMSSPEAAELEKVVENTYRDVNIAFANELARVCDIYGVDVCEIIQACNSQPYSHILNPGLVGGHCIPMDPYYVLSDARDRGYHPRLWATARELNEDMFRQVAGMVGENKRVAVLGLSFKADIKAFDHSHTTRLVRKLQERGCQVVVHDPLLNGAVPSLPVESDVYKAVEGCDCVVLSTAHSFYRSLDLHKVKTLMKGDILIDIRNLFDPFEVERCGLRYQGLGRAGHA